jgi:hypothetical protein
VRRHLLAAFGIFTVAFVVRWWLVQGLVLGDDAQEFGMLEQAVVSGPDLRDQLAVRFGGWIFNYLALLLFGVSETTLILPTWVLSSTFGVLAYVLLVRWGYGTARAFAGGLVVATAPFEVVLGTCRTNDLYLAGALALGFVALVLLETRPVGQGIAVALALWFGFYVKLWAVYALPALGLYALAGRRWRAAAAFVVTSVLAHGAAMLYWKANLGAFAPFVSTHAANYVVPLHDLAREWRLYPRMIFVGSEFGTTLFGLVPWLLAGLLTIRLARRRLDHGDRLLLGFWGSVFLLIEFFPAGFALDGYYTVPRIFRYLAPISFPIALHAAKLLLDVTRGWRPTRATTAIAAVLVANLLGSIDATLPGRIFRDSLHRVVREIERTAPPQVVAEITLGYWLQRLYLDPDVVETEVVTPPMIYEPEDCERWLRDTAPTWPAGTLVVTGLANYVHYGAHHQGLRLAWFERPLDDRWTLEGEYGVLSYLPRPETARLWRLERGRTEIVTLDQPDDPPPPGEFPTSKARYEAGMERFQAADHRAARAHFRAVMATDAAEAEDATFFYAASFFREERWERARHEFKRLLRRFGQGRWVSAAHWHIAIAELRQGHARRARERFAWVAARFANDPATVENSRAELRRLSRRREGLLVRLWRRLRGTEDEATGGRSPRA